MLYALGGLYAWSGEKQGPFFRLCRTQCDPFIGDGPQIFRFDVKFAFTRIDLFISCFFEGIKKFETLAKITYLIDHQHRRKDQLRFILGELFLNLIDASEECFVRDTGTATYSATVQIFDNKDGSAESWLRWHAPDTTGDSILYVLEIHDPFGWSGAFPPAIGDSDSIFMEGDTWVLRASNKRQSRDACLGSGNFDGLALTSVDLTRIF